ncbi:MAG: hypothetical protein IJ693_00680 [Bacteroidaceae bacterium]|nr:hypothetical protein [Bacteroidaceae bacterium]
MRKLFTLVFALAAAFVANAQAPAEWTDGMDVTAQLGLGDCDGSFSGDWKENSYDGGDVSSIGQYWKGSMPNEYSGAAEGGDGCIAFYNQKEFDIYQVVKVPAGTYTIQVQACYREGGFNDTFANYNKGQVKKNVYLYASILSGEDPASEVTRDFNTVIRSLASSTQTSRLYESSLGWASDGSAKVKDAEGNEITVYAPSCNKGCRAFFQAGEYWNSIDIILLEDAYVRMGIRKVASISEDYVPFSNFQVIYTGEAGEAAQLEAAKDECRNALEELVEFQVKVSDAGFEGFAGAIDDVVMDFNDQISGAKSVEALDGILASITETVANYSKSLVFVNSLDDLLNMSAGMLASTSFPGYDAFKAAYDKAVNDAKTDDVEALGEDPGKYFDGVYATLATARATYLDSQEADETGAKDFTSLIKHPWFVNPEYNPTQNEDGTWTLKEATWNWGDVQGQDDYTNKLTGDRVDIASEVELATDESVTNQWYKRLKTFGNGWSANSYHLYYQGGLIGVSNGWCSGFDDWEGVCQQLVGLPNGYYSLRGLARGNAAGDNKWTESNMPPYHNIFAQNSEEVTVSSMVGHTDSYYSPDYGWYEWNPNVWQEHRTGTIQINDGRLLIGCQSSWIANFTGFRLMFYGTNPPFSAMIQEELDAVNKEANDLQFAGDKKVVADLLEQIKLPIPDAATYDAALLVIHDANEYIALAKQAEKNFNADKTYSDLLAKYSTDEAQSILTPPYVYVVSFGESEADTYKDCATLNANAKKYGEYMAEYEKATALDNAELKAVLSKQVAVLTASTTGESAETLDQYMSELALPYNIALFQSLEAGKATVAAPVDVTGILVNPTFAEGPSKGWSGETPTINEYGRENAELWNKSAFTLSQKLVGLPAGTYELRAKAIYRDAGAVNADLVAKFKAAGSEEAWENHNAQLFAKVSDDNDQFSYIRAIEALVGTENSFTEVVTATDEEEDADGNKIVYPTTIQTLAPAGEGETETTAKYEHKNQSEYPFDTQVEVDGTTLFYPSSMYGFYQWCVQHPADVANKVQITINAGETLEVGIRKTAAIGSDWVIFDDFELWYLSGDTFNEMLTGVAEVAAPNANGAIYNLAGQRVGKDYKGIIIQNGVKKLNK